MSAQKKNLIPPEKIAQYEKLLATQPGSGAAFYARQRKLETIRRFPVSGGFEKVLLFYFPLPDGVDLVRVIHASRDFERLLDEGFFD